MASAVLSHLPVRLAGALVMGGLTACMAGCTSFPLIQARPAPVAVQDLAPLPVVRPLPPQVERARTDEKGYMTSLTALPRG